MLENTETAHSPVSIDARYAELFAFAVAAAKEAGWGIAHTHEELVAALQNMAIPAQTFDR
jgi:hypothetical protein